MDGIATGSHRLGRWRMPDSLEWLPRMVATTPISRTLVPNPGFGTHPSWHGPVSVNEGSGGTVGDDEFPRMVAKDGCQQEAR